MDPSGLAGRRFGDSEAVGRRFESCRGRHPGRRGLLAGPELAGPLVGEPLALPLASWELPGGQMVDVAVGRPADGSRARTRVVLVTCSR
jgi:hypothetical protein